ncbi:MAG TPA: LamG-like jellyroll fold domain-containing protein [Candidatus Kapabacteria bacterium]
MLARIYIWSFLLLSSGLTLVSCSENAAVNQEAFGSIMGKVVDTTGSAIGNAIITTSPPSSQTYTAGDGSYELESVPSDVYIVRAEKTSVGYGSATISVLAGKTTTANIILSPYAPTTGVIKGKVTDRDGISISGALVTTLPATRDVLSDSLGDFLITDVPQGIYGMSAIKFGYTEGTKFVSITAGEVEEVIIQLGVQGALPTDGLIAHYPLDSNGNDESGNGFNLTLSNTQFVNSRLGGSTHALDFNGVTSVAVGVHDQRLNAAVITLSFWIKAPQPSLGADSVMSVIGKYITSSVNGYLFYIQGPKIIWYYAWENPNHTFCRINNSITDDNWHHIVGTADNSGAKLFIDGVLANTNSWLGIPGVTTQTAPFSAGFIEPEIVTKHFRGQLDDIRIYNRVLTEKEVADLSQEK